MSFKEFKEEYKKLQTEEERKNFIKKRIESLLKNSEPKRIGKEMCGSYKDFISPNIGVCSNTSDIFADMKMDDLNIYQEFMNYIHNDVDKYMYGEPITINVIQYFIWNYFGYNAGAVFERMDIYSNGRPVSIKELKGKNIAACSERSAMVQNLLKFLGFDSEIIFGKLNGNESHAYIVFKPEKANIRILYDPMNPVEYLENGEKKYCAGVSRMSEEQYTELQNGGTYNFNYDLVKKIFVKNNECVEDKRVYTSDEIKFKQDMPVEDKLKQIKAEYIKVMENNANVIEDTVLDNEQGGIKR